MGLGCKMRKALIVVDVENEWADKNSEYYLGNLSALVRKINTLIDLCRKAGYVIIFTRHVEVGSEDAFVSGSNNVRLIPELHQEKGDVIITKHKISPFYRTNLEKELQGVSHIVAAGILTNLCVRSLVQDAYDRDFSIKVVKDCCVAGDQETQEFTFRDLKATRPEIEFQTLKYFIP